MSFDFDAAVQAPFRMQPGLRRLPEGAAQLTPLAPGSRHQREKLAVLSAFADQHLCAVPGFDAAPALDALCRHAANEHPAAWAWDGERAHALQLGVTVTPAGDVQQLQTGSFGLGDEVGRCLLGLPAAWRLAGLLGLAFAEDFAIVDGPSGTLPWLAVALPSHWAPAAKLGLHFTQVHAPVADNALLLKAGDHLLRMVTGEERWERFVWTITDHPRLHAHPARVDPQRWRHTLTSGASGAIDASGAFGAMAAMGATSSDPKRKSKAMAMLRRMRRKPLLRIGAETAEVFGALAARLAKSGRGSDFRIQDLWLAAQALERKFTLLTSNARDFKDVPGLKFLAVNAHRASV